MNQVAFESIGGLIDIVFLCYSLALGRSRAKSPGGDEDDFTANTSRHQKPPVLPFSFSAQGLGFGTKGNGLALNFNAQSRGKYDYKTLMRQSVVEMLPPEGLARQLVTFDVECVSWFHWYAGTSGVSNPSGRLITLSGSDIPKPVAIMAHLSVSLESSKQGDLSFPLF